MKISKALKQIKTLKNQLSRLLKMRQDNFMIVIPKDTDLEAVLDYPDKFGIVKFEDLTKKINNIATEITYLRVKLLITNTRINVNVDGADISLAFLKLKIDDLRSELSQLAAIKTDGLFSIRRRRIRTVEEEEKEMPQLNDLQLEERIVQLETKKNEYETILERANATTDLITS